METTRRELLLASGAALVVGAAWNGVAFAVGKAGAAAFNPSVWVRIEPSGKTFLTVGKSEMGQGVRTSLPMILADELDADWAQIELVQAMPGPTLKRLGTGGSWSIGGSWGALRGAGAAAREMLVAAAAARWKVEPPSCRTEGGQVIHDASGRKLGYGELVAEAAKQPVPAQPKLKKASEMRLIGKPMKRLDGPRITGGTAVYGIDVKVPGMLHASIERAPVVGDRPGKVDARAARAVPGVKHVVTIPTGVAVVAETTWAAMKGREALKVEWAKGPNGDFDSAGHWRRLEEGAGQKGVVTRSENPGAARAPSARVVQARYVYPFAAHAPVEPMNCIAQVKGGKARIWAPTQHPNRVQQEVAEALGLTIDHVSVETPLIGGGFGRRLNADFAVEAAEVARQVPAPVQVLWTRADDMKHGHFQAASIHEMWGAVDGGRGVGWKHKKVSSPHNLGGPPTAEDLADPVAFFQGSSWGVYDNPYVFPSLETSYVRVDVPVPIGPWRAVFSPSSTFARECFLDELAGAAGVDPLAFRLRMLEGPDTVKAGDLTIDRRRLRRVLELVRDRSGWSTPLPPGRFRGVACNVYDGETHVAYVAEVSVPPGRPEDSFPWVVHRVVCAIDCGVIVNPLGIAQQVESGVIWGMSNMKGEITFAGGRAQQANYIDFPVTRMSEAPVVETHLVDSHGEQPFGMGEPTVPPVAPAVANAVFAATGERLRRLPCLPVRKS